MKQPSPNGVDETESIFGQALELIHSTLIDHYRLTEDEARGAEDDLRAWFGRLVRRGASRPPARILQIALLSAACQYGRSLKFWNLRSAPSQDRVLNDFLKRHPDDVAADLQRRLDKGQA